MEKRKLRISLAACSDPVLGNWEKEVYQLTDLLRGEGLDVVMDPAFFGNRNLEGVQKARLLMDLFSDPEMDFIFDVSGGDLANCVLPYLDYDVIRNSRAVFCGYSDLSTVINAIIAKTGRSAINYQIRNILYDHAEEQLQYVKNTILQNRISGTDLKAVFLRGTSMEGTALGGNIRCFEKLAGTPFWPDMKGSILLLEGNTSNLYKVMTALEQYRQMGVFDQISGILLGTFTKMEADRISPSAGELVMKIVPEHIPVAATRYFGHYTDAKAIVLGTHQSFCADPS